MRRKPFHKPETSFGSFQLLRRALTYWQSNFRLTDWIFRLELVARRNMTRPDRAGEVIRDARRREVLIRLLDPADLDGSTPFDYDYRRILAHEFVRAVTWCIPSPEPDTLEETTFEQAIETLACGIFEMTPWELIMSEERPAESVGVT